ncbi:MAG TPA: hypothetical protein VGY53_09905 [Isosphaeraceae bacterium]|nr:hypothetical protein [Isosphaeraceae bacterium]
MGEAWKRMCALAMLLAWGSPALADDAPAPHPLGEVANQAEPNLKAEGPGTAKAKGETALSPAASDQTRLAKPAEGPEGKEPGEAKEAADARADALAKVKELGAEPGNQQTAENKALREVLEERLRWLDEWDKATKARQEAEHPAQSPERELSQVNLELERLRVALDQSGRDPSSLLPESFRVRPERVTSSIMDEMKQAIEAAQSDFKQASSELEAFRAAQAQRPGGGISALRTERDQIHQRCTALPARRAEREAAVSAATTDEARALARERLLNFEWEARVEQLRLRAKEAQISLEEQRAALAEPQLKLREARRELGKHTLEAMEAQHRVVVEHQQRALKSAAAREEVVAEFANDPLKRYRAKQNAELLALRAQVLNDEHAAQTGPSLSLDLQRDLADRAGRDFASLKRLVEEGRASSLVALRLKNDYRRLSAERAAVARTELARAADEMTRYENALTAVELDLVNDSRDERFVLDGLLEALPANRRAEALALATEHEGKHRALLDQRRQALEKLADQAAEVHKQVQRRLQTLDEQYAFVRTHIFWMRDEEPVGLTTLGVVPRECRRIARAVYHITCECGDSVAWSQVRVEFSLFAFAAIILPWPLHRARRALSHMLKPENEPQAS